METIDRQYDLACSKVALFDLSTRTKVELLGPEAGMFLHNLCTNDVKNLAEGAGCEAFLTTAKARVIAHFFVNHFKDNFFLLDAVPGQTDVLMRHLDHYLISERVEIVDRTKELALVRVVGPQARSFCETSFGFSLEGLKPLEHREVILKDGAQGWVRRFDGLSIPAFDFFGPHFHLDLEASDPQVHEILRVEASLPEFGIDIDDTRLVMEVGRTKQAINYAKGCFLGQEPIVMARDRGQINRTLLGVKIAKGEVLPRGAKLFSGEAEVGLVTSSVRSPRLGEIISMAYLKRGHQDVGLALTVEPTTDGRQAIVSGLPFIGLPEANLTAEDAEGRRGK